MMDPIKVTENYRGFDTVTIFSEIKNTWCWNIVVLKKSSLYHKPQHMFTFVRHRNQSILNASFLYSKNKLRFPQFYTKDQTTNLKYRTLQKTKKNNGPYKGKANITDVFNIVTVFAEIKNIWR